MPAWLLLLPDLSCWHDNTTQKLNLSSSFSILFCLLLFCLVLLMATLEEKISALEEEIAKNTARLDKAIADGKEDKEERYVNLITAIRQDITAIRQQQSQGE